jgi:hypothetical protein
LDVASRTEVRTVRKPGDEGWTKGERVGGMGVGMEKCGAGKIIGVKEFLGIRDFSIYHISIGMKIVVLDFMIVLEGSVA